MDPAKSIFWTTWVRTLFFLDISKYLREKFFYQVWGHQTPENPQMDLSKNHFLKAKLNKNFEPPKLETLRLDIQYDKSMYEVVYLHFWKRYITWFGADAPKTCDNET